MKIEKEIEKLKNDPVILYAGFIKSLSRNSSFSLSWQNKDEEDYYYSLGEYIKEHFQRFHDNVFIRKDLNKCSDFSLQFVTEVGNIYSYGPGFRIKMFNKTLHSAHINNSIWHTESFLNFLCWAGEKVSDKHLAKIKKWLAEKNEPGKTLDPKIIDLVLEYRNTNDSSNINLFLEDVSKILKEKNKKYKK